MHTRQLVLHPSTSHLCLIYENLLQTKCYRLDLRGPKEAECNAVIWGRDGVKWAHWQTFTALWNDRMYSQQHFPKYTLHWWTVPLTCWGRLFSLWTVLGRVLGLQTVRSGRPPPPLLGHSVHGCVYWSCTAAQSGTARQNTDTHTHRVRSH